MLNQLPPIGTPLDDVQGPACDLAMRLREECRLVRDTYVEWADDGRNYWTFGHKTEADDGIIIANDIQNFVITQTDIQTKEPPTTTLEAVDTEAPPVFFHNLPAASAQAIGLQPNEYTASIDEQGQAVPPQPLSPDSVMILQNAIAAGQLPPNVLITLTTSEVVDFFQKIYDVIWKRSDPDEWYWENTTLNNVDGWCPAIYEFDDANKRHILTNLPIRQFFCDPTTYDAKKWRWCMPDLVYGADMAKALHPDIAEEIDEHATPTGKIERPPNAQLMGSQYEDVTNFQTPMITLSVLFLRDQQCLMKPEKAVADGHLEKRTIGTGNWTQAPTPEDPNAMQEEKRDALYHAGTDDEAIPPGEDGHDPETWPTYTCDRQLTMVSSKNILLADEECSYWDFPVALNFNIPVLGKPFGQGEPYRLKSMQDGRTRTLNAMADHAEMFPKPITWAPASARERLPKDVKDGFEWGMHLWPDDDTIAKTNGQVVGVIHPPEMSQTLPVVDDKLKREMNDSGGNMAAIQGQPADQVGQMSGVAIAQIQAGASSLSSFKARRMQAVIRRIAHLAFHSIITRMTPADYSRIIKRYPPHVVEAIHGMGKDLEWTINVSVSAGTGATLQSKKAEAKDDFARGLRSKQTTQEIIGADPQLEQQRQGEEAAEMAAVQQRITPQQPRAGGGQPQA